MNHESSPNPGIRRTGVVAGAYVPQIWHLVKAHCSAGISIRAYFLWFLASLLFLVHAAMIKDIVFVLVQVVNLLAIAAVVFHAKRYQMQIMPATS
jgi:uncharacterized protein with PQ loop repeat